MRNEIKNSGIIRILLITFSLIFIIGASEFTSLADSTDTRESEGWHEASPGKYYYVDSNGERAKKGWLKLNGKKFYIGKNGYRYKKLKKIGKNYYYFHKTKGFMCTGWKTVSGKRYYFTKKGSAKKGWLTYKGKIFHFDDKAVMQKGWQKIDEYEYYFNEDGTLLINTYSPDGFFVDEDGKKLQKSTLKKFLKTALQPVGQTMYVWGGGWNEADTGAGEEAVTIGVSPKWKEFFEAQNANYNYNNTRYQIHNGLDCSGYVGWTVYNAFNTMSGNAGYVMEAQKMASCYADKGWGVYRQAGTFTDYRAGDILSSAGHVYIVIGQCSDSSVLLVHSTPQGVMINGTCTRSGSYDSQASKLAKQYMEKYYPEWCAKYPITTRNLNYLNGYNRMRWKLKGASIMKDPDKYQKKTAEQILADLFS